MPTVIRYKRFRLRIRQPRHASFMSWEDVRVSLLTGPNFNRVC